MLQIWKPVKLCHTREIQSFYSFFFSFQTWSKNYVYDISWAVWLQQRMGKVECIILSPLPLSLSLYFDYIKQECCHMATQRGATAVTFCIEKLFCSKYLPSIFIRLPPATFDKLWLCYFCCHSPRRCSSPSPCGVCFFSQTMAVSCHDSAATLYNKCSK